MLAIVSASISFASIVVIAVAFARASPSPARRSRRRVVSSIRSASRVVASTPRASSRVAPRVVARRTFAVAVRRASSPSVASSSSRRFAPRVVDDATVRVVRVVVSDGPCAPGFDPRASAIFDATPSRARRRRPWRRCTRG